MLSHLGSQTEIFVGIFDAVLSGQDPPGPEAFPPIWDVWNAKSSEDQAKDFVRVDTALLERLEALDDDQLATPVSMFGMDLNVLGLVRMRLSEHALHTWDVAVTRDDAAQLADDAAAILVDQAGQLAARAGAPGARRFRWRCAPPPRRADVLSVGDKVELSPGADDEAEGRLDLPAESLVRLVAGRLDPEHTPTTVHAEGVPLDEIRAIFPGL